MTKSALLDGQIMHNIERIILVTLACNTQWVQQRNQQARGIIGSEGRGSYIDLSSSSSSLSTINFLLFRGTFPFLLRLLPGLCVVVAIAFTHSRSPGVVPCAFSAPTLAALSYNSLLTAFLPRFTLVRPTQRPLSWQELRADEENMCEPQRETPYRTAIIYDSTKQTNPAGVVKFLTQNSSLTRSL
jgi:hypothetical protein